MLIRIYSILVIIWESFFPAEIIISKQCCRQWNTDYSGEQKNRHTYMAEVLGVGTGRIS
jgi:hypothetical protein